MSSYLDAVLANTHAFQNTTQRGNSLLPALMAKLADSGQGGAGGSLAGAASARLGTPVHASGNVDSWINQALSHLGLDQSYHNGIANLIMHESGGNPNAINNWDSNAKAGHPSQGLMQTIPGTFNQYRDPSLSSNIYDPIANIVAGIRYARSRYGDGMLKSGGRKDSSGKYIGY